MEILVRSARVSEQAALGALKLAASLAWADHVEEIRGLPDAGSIDDRTLAAAFVAEAEGALAGFASLSFHGDQAELDDLFVDPRLWRHGFGAALLEGAARRTRFKGAQAIRVIANLRAEAFYRARGFVVVGEEDTLFARARVMELRLRRLLPTRAESAGEKRDLKSVGAYTFFRTTTKEPSPCRASSIPPSPGARPRAATRPNSST
ncbi:MAG: GNAT family N-acetyltransferase [Caulobacteraceae bacterium]